jgi:hypothetical protein
VTRHRRPQRSLPDGRRPQEGEPQERREFRFSNAVELLRQLVLRTSALAHAAEDLYLQLPWNGDKEIRRQKERLDHLICGTAEESDALVDACSLIAEEFIGREQGA